jgi:hypothetical protein
MSRKPRPRASAKGGHDEEGDDEQRQQQQAGSTERPAGLTLKQFAALEALLRGQTMSAAAVAGGVNDRTMRRWVHEPVFRQTLMEARRDAFGQAVGLTARYAPVAVATLVKVMNDNLASPSARVAAAGLLLKFGREGLELDDLASRIEALEQAAAIIAKSHANPQLHLVEEGDE